MVSAALGLKPQTMNRGGAGIETIMTLAPNSQTGSPSGDESEDPWTTKEEEVQGAMEGQAWLQEGAEEEEVATGGVDVMEEVDAAAELCEEAVQVQAEAEEVVVLDGATVDATTAAAAGGGRGGGVVLAEARPVEKVVATLGEVEGVVEGVVEVVPPARGTKRAAPVPVVVEAARGTEVILAAAEEPSGAPSGRTRAAHCGAEKKRPALQPVADATAAVAHRA